MSIREQFILQRSFSLDKSRICYWNKYNIKINIKLLVCFDLTFLKICVNIKWTIQEANLT